MARHRSRSSARQPAPQGSKPKAVATPDPTHKERNKVRRPKPTREGGRKVEAVDQKTDKRRRRHASPAVSDPSSSIVGATAAHNPGSSSASTGAKAADPSPVSDQSAHTRAMIERQILERAETRAEEDYVFFFSHSHVRSCLHMCSMCDML